MAQLAKRSGVHAAKPHALESGREKSISRESLGRMADTLGCLPADLAAAPMPCSG